MAKSRRPDEQASRTRVRAPDGSSDARARNAWLARSLDEEVRAPLLRALLWTEHVLNERPDADASEDGRRRGHESVERELLSALTRIEDLLSIVRPEADPESDGPWLRSIVVRDLVGAVLRELEPELKRKDVAVDLRIVPQDLHLVADSNWALHAVEALVRAGVRSTAPGEILSISAASTTADRAETEEDGAWMTLILTAPGFELSSMTEKGGADGGSPWRWDRAPTGAVPLALAAAGRYTAHMGGLLDLAPTDHRKGIRLRLRLPADREPERRPGWIP